MKILNRFILFFTLFFISCVYDTPYEEQIINQGDFLPDFEIRLDDDKLISTSSLFGKVTLIFFFTTSCNDCRKAFPIIQEVKNYNLDVEIICISRDEGPLSIAEYWKNNNLTLPYSAQENRKIYNLFATSGVPRLYISDKTTKVVAAYNDKSFPSAQEINSIIISISKE